MSDPLNKIWGELNMHRLLIMQLYGVLAQNAEDPQNILNLRDRTQEAAESMQFVYARADDADEIREQMLTCHREFWADFERFMRDPQNRR